MNSNVPTYKANALSLQQPCRKADQVRCLHPHTDHMINARLQRKAANRVVITKQNVTHCLVTLLGQGLSRQDAWAGGGLANAYVTRENNYRMAGPSLASVCYTQFEHRWQGECLA